MKKKITMPDGTIQEIEGTPEELAEYEKKVKSGDVSEGGKKSKRRILTEQVSQELQALIKEELEKQPKVCYHFCTGCSICHPPFWLGQPVVPNTIPYSDDVTIIPLGGTTTDKILFQS